MSASICICLELPMGFAIFTLIYFTIWMNEGIWIEIVIFISIGITAGRPRLVLAGERVNRGLCRRGEPALCRGRDWITGSYRLPWPVTGLEIDRRSAP
ncbi:hypothetical protein ACFXKW_33720 [Streptomyces sp. NPDC059193]|uniref:hypothetical protein n=1 Tax=Streptomyces sp. NPDC059193 TaxID=3346763 RepID=UPI0036C01050